MCIYRKFFNYYAIQIALNVADFLHSLFKNVNPSSVFILLLIFLFFGSSQPKSNLNALYFLNLFSLFAFILGHVLFFAAALVIITVCLPLPPSLSQFCLKIGSQLTQFMLQQQYQQPEDETDARFGIGETKKIK